MKIVVCKPEDRYLGNHLKHILYQELKVFYDLLKKVLEKHKINYEFKEFQFRGSVSKPGVLCIGHHVYDNPENVWTVKRGYVPGYLYFDKKGYSGWSEGVERYNPNAPYTQEQITAAYQLGHFYINNNISKRVQAESCTIPSKPYVLVLNQKPADTVSRLAYIPTTMLHKFVKEAYENTGIGVYVKEHPGVHKKTSKNESLHELIRHSEAVYTVNSGAGFEALLHGKKVYTSGACDYSPVTSIVKSYEDICNTIDEPSFSLDEIAHYLHYAFNDHFVDAFNEEAIERKLFRAINEYII